MTLVTDHKTKLHFLNLKYKKTHHKAQTQSWALKLLDHKFALKKPLKIYTLYGYSAPKPLKKKLKPKYLFIVNLHRKNDSVLNDIEAKGRHTCSKHRSSIS